MSDEAIRNRLSRFGVVCSSRRCKLHTVPGIFNGIRVFGIRYLIKICPLFCVLGGAWSAWSTKIRFSPVVSTIDHQARVCPNIFCFNCEELGLIPVLTKFTVAFVATVWLFVLMESSFFSFTIRHLWHACATALPVVYNFHLIFSAIHRVFWCICEIC